MRIPRVRFTVRGLMALVALVCLALGFALYLREKSATLSVGYAVRADRHWHRMYDLRMYDLSMALYPGAGSGTASAARIAHHKAMEAKYRRAARYPWLPVVPDPPEPK